MQPAPIQEPIRLATSVRAAGPGDVRALVTLVNEAYDIERFFVEGDRTDADEIAAMMQVGHFLVLDRDPGTSARRGLAAAVFVRIEAGRGYFGMLSVAPDLRNHGLGKRLVAVAEALCQARGCTAMDLQIVNLREELGPWYRSLGYHETGTAPFATRESTQPCFFIKMSKSLA